ncbi:MAG: tRNA (adenosine(37)-N6)-threonylcarbamoyltransferase complex dimerization subunit type 1 TsaB [Ruminococcus sp.]|nr:tRNA (adenosine(37)-N6)-threonylcarbamoyltransferase complex dimerization subunit type 1 TsaB [Ruminococcus sp.]
MKTENKTLILGLDTCGETASAALFDGESVIGEIKIKSGRSHSVIVTDMIADVIALCRKDKTDLTGIAVSVGPGSYTGIRIGIAAALGLAFALGIPIAPVSSLLGAASEGLCAVTKKARNDLIYAALYQDFKPILSDFITTAYDFNTLLSERNPEDITFIDGNKITAAGIIAAAVKNPELFGGAENVRAVYLEPTKAEKDLG